MAFRLEKMTHRQLPGSSLAVATGLVLSAAGVVMFGTQPAPAAVAMAFAWMALAYGAFGRKTLPSELFLTLGWACLLLFLIFVHGGSQRWWIGIVIGVIALLDLVGMLRRRARRLAPAESDQPFDSSSLRDSEDVPAEERHPL